MVVNKVTMPAQPNINIRRAFLNRKVPGDFDNLNGNDCPTIMNNFKNVPRTGNTQLQTNSQTSTSTRVTTSCSTQSTRRTTSSDHKATIMKTDLSEFRNNMKNMKNSGLSLVTEQIRNSLENLIDEKEDEEMNEPVIEFPDDTPVPSEVGSPTTTMETMKFEHKTANSNFKKTQVINGVKTEKESTNSAEVKKLQAGELSYEENMAAQKRRALLEVDGVSAEKSQLSASEAISLKLGDLSQRECNNMAQTNMKVSSGQFSKEQTALQTQGEKQTVTNSKFYNQQHSSTLSTYSTTSRGITTSASVQSCTQKQIELNLEEDKIINMPLDDLESLSKDSSQQDIDTAKKKYSVLYERLVDSIQKNEIKSKPEVLDKMYDVMQKAWAVPTHGLELGYTLCNTLRTCGGLDMLMANCTIPDAKDLKFSSARLLEQSLITENREYVVANGLEKVVNVACICTKKTDSVEHSRVGTGILEHLFKDSVETCSDVVRLGGLDALLFECRKSDIETLRHCAGALANLSLYGGTENQEAMIKRKVPMWLFPLALHTDDNIKYYACLAITVLVANAEIEADVLQSGTLDLVEPFVTSHNPSEFAKSNLAHAHGQSKSWLKQLVPVLKSKREEARNLAAFHFCMEAGIKKQQGNTNIFSEINAIESLQTVASCPNAIASKYAAQALRLIGEKVPHKLSQQVPLWSVTDVREWVKQIGFEEHADRFYSSCVDGDLLLQLNDENLARDIEMQNGIKRKRFTRELQKLKKMADYSSKDTSNINNFLQNLGPEFSIYTYSFLNAGVEDKETLRNLSEDQLAGECGIRNSIHRFRILEGIKQIENCLGPQVGDQLNKSLDVFVSYRRSNGSQLASLLKVHLQLRGFSVFIDVERLEAGKFDNNLLQSIQKAKHFLLVLTPSSLDRCMKDDDGKDWVHREIVAALNSKCNIVPIIDNFQWPEADELPEDMRQICHFNGVRWIHDYQDACVEKIERFLRGEPNAAGMPCLKGDLTPGTQTRVPPTYQRLLSNDSGSGKEKDVNGNSGHNRSD